MQAQALVQVPNGVYSLILLTGHSITLMAKHFIFYGPLRFTRDFDLQCSPF
jgi:hypothetical protein